MLLTERLRPPSFCTRRLYTGHIAAFCLEEQQMITNKRSRIKRGAKKRAEASVWDHARASMAHDVRNCNEQTANKWRQSLKSRKKERKYTGVQACKWNNNVFANTRTGQRTQLHNDNMQRLFCSLSGWLRCQSFEADSWCVQTKDLKKMWP